MRGLLSNILNILAVIEAIGHAWRTIAAGRAAQSAARAVLGLGADVLNVARCNRRLRRCGYFRLATILLQREPLPNWRRLGGRRRRGGRDRRRWRAGGLLGGRRGCEQAAGRGGG